MGDAGSRGARTRSGQPPCEAGKRSARATCPRRLVSAGDSLAMTDKLMPTTINPTPPDVAPLRGDGDDSVPRNLVARRSGAQETDGLVPRPRISGGASSVRSRGVRTAG